MDVDPMDTIEQLTEERAADARSARLNAIVAITVAVLATFMSICKVKDDNIVQAMQRAQADRLDQWSFYQARNIRQEVAMASVEQLKLARLGRAPAEAAAYDAAIARYEQLAAEQSRKKDESKQLATQAQASYDALNFHDDQFDLSDAALSLAIALLAVTALTHQRWLYAATWLPIGFGVFMGLSGLLGWHFHPDALVRLLT